MRFDDPQLVDLLARQYVLGTLRGPARRRFAREARRNLVVRRAIQDWERRLAGLASELRPVEPPAYVWKRIARATGGKRPTAPARTGRLGAALAAVFAMAAIVFGGLYLTDRPEPLTSGYIAVLQDTTDQAPAWSVQAYPDAQLLRIRPIADVAPPPGRVFELWMLPADGSTPVSLGVVATPTAAVELSLDERQLTTLRETSALAISIEPPGGSPTGAPTGDVVFVGNLHQG